MDISEPYTPPLVMLNVPPGQLIQLQRAVARSATEIGNGALDLGKAHDVDVADHRHDKARRSADRDAHVDEVLVDDVVAVDLGVYGGELLQRGDSTP